MDRFSVYRVLRSLNHPSKQARGPKPATACNVDTFAPDMNEKFQVINELIYF
jgi:hypothetical protein